ncbi:hypothetical protein WDU94_014328 [Cyamophila willieti]
MSVSEAFRCLVFYTLFLYLLLTFFFYERTEKILFILVIEYVAMRWFHQELFENYVQFEAEMICWFNKTEEEDWCDCYWDCCCEKHRYVPPWEKQPVWYKTLLWVYSKHYKTMCQVFVYAVYLYLKSAFIVAHFNQFLCPQDWVMASMYDVRYVFLLLFLLPYTLEEFQWQLFTILTQRDFTTHVQIYLTRKSYPRMSLVSKLSFWWMVEMVLYHVTPVYSLKVLVYGVYSLEALLKVCVR